ncbi:MAG TPA: YicC/YloC family endoribonuclease [Candidatus Methylomirabilis sp.]|nr:YicC/YloC family endoribonuclease [Candidatus Methylomirabilis sp.]
MTQPSPAASKKAECFSMTGFAQARSDQSGWGVRVSIKSVNHRFLDLKLRLPEGFDIYEPRIRRILRERVHRGHVEVYVGVDPPASAPVQINHELAETYMRAAEQLHQHSKFAADLDVVSVLRLPGVVAGLTVAVPEAEDERERLGKALEGCLVEALQKLDDMRRAEGRHLVEDLRARLVHIREIADQVRELAASLRPAFARRLDARLKELLGGVALDPARLAQEAALLAERGDVSEELDRLRSHVQQFAKVLEGAGEMGKKLDFLLQEMHREANTLLSKTPGVESEALAITGLALEIKAEIEKLREQVQNIE